MFGNIGVAYFVSNPIVEGASQIPTITTTNFKVVDDIGGRSQEPSLHSVVDDIGGNRPVGEFAFCLNSIKDIGGKSTTGELNTISDFEIGGNRPVGEIAFCLNEVSDIGGRSSDGGLLNLTLIDLPIGGVKVPSGELKLTV
ncbi:hypothetical protein [Flavobacterium aciduliphilum]|uniref:Uncharacterized protein n=1 Tax=Flavobacterium aciduliphilum TaxID=1101402 RepID=A0A328YRM8_9FLAO|nr:hypothetical protein [Flavobacterium aciduliphilum]RAR75793.1 hypothetical protein CLV55_101498 [Flavobacterium aciduliphilum]